MTRIVAALIALAAAAPAAAQDASKGIVQYVAESPDFQTLYSCLGASGLAGAFDEGVFTVFAPSDEAFAKLPKETVDNLLEDKEALARILKYHVIPGKVMASDVAQADGEDVATLLEGCPLPIAVRGDAVMVGTARVTKADVPATNGVIHVIDAVLMPPDE